MTNAFSPVAAAGLLPGAPMPQPGLALPMAASGETAVSADFAALLALGLKAPAGEAGMPGGLSPDAVQGPEGKSAGKSAGKVTGKGLPTALAALPPPADPGRGAEAGLPAAFAMAGQRLADGDMPAQPAQTQALNALPPRERITTGADLASPDPAIEERLAAATPKLSPLLPPYSQPMMAKVTIALPQQLAAEPDGYERPAPDGAMEAEALPGAGATDTEAAAPPLPLLALVPPTILAMPVIEPSSGQPEHARRAFPDQPQPGATPMPLPAIQQPQTAPAPLPATVLLQAAGRTLALPVPPSAIAQPEVQSMASDGRAFIPPSLQPAIAPGASATQASRGQPDSASRTNLPEVSSVSGLRDAPVSPGPVELPMLAPAPAPALAPTLAPLPPQASQLALSTLPEPRPHDFSALVDRLVEARATALSGQAPQIVEAVLPNREFGAVALRFDLGGEALSVAVSSPDPDFTRAVLAAAPAPAATTADLRQDSSQPGTGQSGNAASNSQGQGQPGHAPHSQTGARTASPARSPHDEGNPAAPSLTPQSDTPRSRGLFA